MTWNPITKPITPRIALEIVGHEAVIRQAYKDSVGKWTWSVGLTSATGHRVTRYMDNAASMERCMAVYIWALDNYAAAVRERFASTLLTEEAFGAATSFHWNTGSIRKASWVKHYLAADLERAHSSFLSWSKPPEIKPRRRKEARLLFQGEWDNPRGTAVEYTRVKPGSYSPDWGSAKNVDLSPIIERLLGAGTTSKPVAIIDQPPKPDALTENQIRTHPWWDCAIQRLTQEKING